MHSEHYKAFAAFDTAYLSLVGNLVKGDYVAAQADALYWRNTKDDCRPIIASSASEGRIELLQAVHDAITYASYSLDGSSKELVKNYSHYVTVREKVFSLIHPEDSPDISDPIPISPQTLKTNINFKKTLQIENPPHPVFSRDSARAA